MDEGCNRAVNHFFVKLYEKGYIYRGNRLINWCPKCGTSLSDAEVEHEDKNGKYWYFRYPAADGGEGVVVATSRPETMFGDVAIAVHPEDERYKDLVGKRSFCLLWEEKFRLWQTRIRIRKKEPAPLRLRRPMTPTTLKWDRDRTWRSLCCINEDATMNSLAGKYEGMDRYECRKAWIADLEEAGYLVKTEDKVIPVGECYRLRHGYRARCCRISGSVKMEELAKPAIEVAKKGELKHVPERFEKTYLHWLKRSVTGAFPVSCGGDTGFRRGTARTAERLS